MCSGDKQPIVFGRPADESLDPYKQWISEITIALGGKVEDTITEDVWEMGWKKFWRNAEK